eukprot:760276-Hanusia_phi.AAC.1
MRQRISSHTVDLPYPRLEYGTVPSPSEAGRGCSVSGKRAASEGALGTNGDALRHAVDHGADLRERRRLTWRGQGE